METEPSKRPTSNEDSSFSTSGDSFTTTKSSKSSNSSSSGSGTTSSPVLLRNVQAAFKRQRSLGPMQSSLMPRRAVPQREKAKGCSGGNKKPAEAGSVSQALTAKSSVGQKKDVNTVVGGTKEVAPILGPRRLLPPLKEKGKGCLVDNKRLHEVQNHIVKSSIGENKDTDTTVGECLEDASITPPSLSGTITTAFEDNHVTFRAQRNGQIFSNTKEEDDAKSSVTFKSQYVPGANISKKVQFALASNSTSKEMEWDMSSQVETSNITNNEAKDNVCRSMDIDYGNKMSSLQDQIHQFGNFLHSDVGQPVTQSSYIGSSCVTTASACATLAPVLYSTSNYSGSQQESASCAAVGGLADAKLHPESITQIDSAIQLSSSTMIRSTVITEQLAIARQASSAVADVKSGFNEHHQTNVAKEKEVLKEPSPVECKSIETNKHSAIDNIVAGSVPNLTDSSSDKRLEPSIATVEKAVTEKGVPAPRKKHYDPDLFFKVNGKLYQRLGKIGSGGSSEVHKVISADCMIYALKKIKLKGRDYASGYGFCQEILYLNKLKGKSNIIQLIDYEVTDKALLEEVMKGFMTPRDGRIKDDRYIYMVLEYGEIDLAHMLAQKWKEMESSDSSVDENWLRFYWQQILQAVNTIHEERIVHSDLKPANFLLVKGALKLIDFGIAKAIMSDTTNIQRDSQVGTLSYMSPEAFLCNETDTNGNVIKCGRPSDIWSLGCILYQMVYGRTPFSEYKTFWAKFKVITDPNHEISYGPVPNPCLLDLMKKCLAWDRNERWRIPQLLQHPFLAPPPLHQPSFPLGNCKAIQLIADSCLDDQEASTLCSKLQELNGASPASRAEQLSFLTQTSSLCFQLEARLRLTNSCI